MSKKLICVTGFPCSGTTFLFDAIRGHPECEGFPTELGLQRLWEASQYSHEWLLDQSAKLDNESLLAWLGVYAFNASRTHGAAILDAIATLGTTKTTVVVKTPEWQVVRGWPDAYISASGVFKSCQMVVCKREPKETYLACLNKLAFYNQPFSDFMDKYEAYYANVTRAYGDTMIAIEHSAMPNSHLLESLTDLLDLGGPCITRPYRFVAHSWSSRSWQSVTRKHSTDH